MAGLKFCGATKMRSQMKKQLWNRSVLTISLILLLSACGNKEEDTAPPVQEKQETASATKEDTGVFNLAELTQSANSGDVKSQVRLADHYDLTGQYQEAFNWYQKAAIKGHAAAQRSLANLYNEGNGIEANPTLAYSWYRKAALQNDGEAMLALVGFFNEGIVIPEDTFKADELYQKAKTALEQKAKEGEANAQRNLGLMLIESGAAQDVKTGLEWLSKAAQTGDSRAEASLGWAYTQESAENKLPDINTAILWYEKAAAQNNIDALLELGNLYPRLGLTQENKDKAIEVYTRAVQAGSADAQIELAAIYLDGGPFAGSELTSPDPKKGLELLVSAAQKGNTDALDRLIDLYENGSDGVPKNTEEALKWSKFQLKNVEAQIEKKLAQENASAPQQ